MLAEKIVKKREKPGKPPEAPGEPLAPTAGKAGRGRTSEAAGCGPRPSLPTARAAPRHARGPRAGAHWPQRAREAEGQEAATGVPAREQTCGRKAGEVCPQTGKPKSVIRPPTMSIGLSFWGFPSPFALLPASCLPLCLDVARYAFDKGDSQSARQQNEIALDSNDRFGVKVRPQ